MSSRLGRRPSEGELYIGHFFGPYAGAKAITLAASNPDANAAEIFPAAAHANRPIFYDKQGQARSIAGGLRGIGAPLSGCARRYAARRAGRRGRLRRSRSRWRAHRGSQRRPRPRLRRPSRRYRRAAMAFAADANAPGPSSSGTSPARTEAAGGMFHSLFQTGQRREAVAPAITELWSGGQRTQDGWRRTGDR